jgi:hypothetical protein
MARFRDILLIGYSVISFLLDARLMFGLRQPYYASARPVRFIRASLLSKLQNVFGNKPDRF